MITAIGQGGAIRNTFGERTVEPSAAAGERSRKQAPPAPPSTALVATETPRRRPAGRVWRNRPSAPFLAQMIATRAGLPQTRHRRRTGPAAAVAAYAATAAAPGTRHPGGRLRLNA